MFVAITTVIVYHAVPNTADVGMQTATACHAAGGITLDPLMTMAISPDITVNTGDQASVSALDHMDFMAAGGNFRICPKSSVVDDVKFATLRNF